MNTRSDWPRDEIAASFDLPFDDLLHRAHTIYRAPDDANAVQLGTLPSIASRSMMIREKAGGDSTSEATRALCSMVGPDAISTGRKLLASGAAGEITDAALFAKRGLHELGGEGSTRTPSRHPGLEPGSRYLDVAVVSGTPGQARGDEELIWRRPGIKKG